MDRLRKGLRSEKGFTLVELMVVVVIIGVLVAIVIPIFNLVVTNAANGAHNANVRTLKGAASMHVATVGLTAAAAGSPYGSGSDLEDYLEEWPDVPDNSDATGTYSVTINADGSIDVTPDYVH